MVGFLMDRVCLGGPTCRRTIFHTSLPIGPERTWRATNCPGSELQPLLYEWPGSKLEPSPLHDRFAL